MQVCQSWGGSFTPTQAWRARDAQNCSYEVPTQLGELSRLIFNPEHAAPSWTFHQPSDIKRTMFLFILCCLISESHCPAWHVMSPKLACYHLPSPVPKRIGHDCGVVQVLYQKRGHITLMQKKGSHNTSPYTIPSPPSRPLFKTVKPASMTNLVGHNPPISMPTFSTY